MAAQGDLQGVAEELPLWKSTGTYQDTFKAHLLCAVMWCRYRQRYCQNRKWYSASCVAATEVADRWDGLAERWFRLLKDDLGWSKKHANISMTFFFFFTRAHRSVVSQVDGSVWSNTSRFSESLGFPTWPLSGCTHSLESIRPYPHFGFLGDVFCNANATHSGLDDWAFSSHFNCHSLYLTHHELGGSDRFLNKKREIFTSSSSKSDMTQAWTEKFHSI